MILTSYGKKFTYDGFIAALKEANDSYHHISLMQLIKKEELLQFPGMGRKTANLVLGTAFKIDTISVDTHVHCISNRLGILKTKNSEETEQDLGIFIDRRPKVKFHKVES